ncbi:MAG: hypothetical protein H6563_02325 [Lewinellaceae bacterium]|nr:hypothetical protein [Lewinellaceae bacterium]
MKAILPFFFLCLLTGLSAQPDPSFPANWVGNWTGELEIYGASGMGQKIFMGLNIQPTGAAGEYTYEITYGTGDAQQIRSYVLQTVDAEKGHYRIDEGNSILLDSYWLGPALVEIFSVDESLLITTTEQIEENVLLWQIIVGQLDATTVTGGSEADGEEIPPVTSYLAPGLQRARLVRK